MLETNGHMVKSQNIATTTDNGQAELSTCHTNLELQHRLNDLNPDLLSPKQALEMLYELKQLV
jgi:hypothetical protein